MALGAGQTDVQLILKREIVPAGVGIVASVLFSASTASMMAAFLYRVRPHDPGVFLAVPLLLLTVAVLASYLPARRAARMDPVVAPRQA